ncbi:hypothetical protein SLA2020_442170 [Shorea laevis]
MNGWSIGTVSTIVADLCRNAIVSIETIDTGLHHHDPWLRGVVRFIALTMTVNEEKNEQKEPNLNYGLDNDGKVELAT